MKTSAEIETAMDKVLNRFNWKNARAIATLLGMEEPARKWGQVLMKRCLERYLGTNGQSVTEEEDGLRASIIVYDDCVNVDLSLVAVNENLKMLERR